MNKTAFRHGRLRSRFSACFLLIIAIIFFNHVKDLWAGTDFPADAVVEKVADLGVIESEPAILGRDGGYSVRFQNHSIWIYGDTVIRQNDHSAPALLSNSCSRTTDRDAGDGLTGFKPCRDTNGIPRELIPFTAEELAFNTDHQAPNCPSEPCGSRWALWPGAAVSDSVNNRLNGYKTIRRVIEGPWSEPLKAFNAKEPLNAIGWIYDAMEHPEYAEKNGKVIYITYSRQTGPLTFELRLVRISLKRA